VAIDVNGSSGDRRGGRSRADGVAEARKRKRRGENEFTGGAFAIGRQTRLAALCARSGFTFGNRLTRPSPLTARTRTVVGTPFNPRHRHSRGNVDSGDDALVSGVPRHGVGWLTCHFHSKNGSKRR